MGRGAVHDVALVQLHGAVAVLATELGVAINEGFDEGLDLPEGLIAGAAGTDAAAFHLTLVELLGDGRSFGGHGTFPGTGEGSAK